jgi:hypothetical protein
MKIHRTGAERRAALVGTTYYPFNGYEIDSLGTVTTYIRVGTETLAANKGGEEPGNPQNLNRTAVGRTEMVLSV